MALHRQEFNSMYQAYFGEYRKTDILYCLMGSRDPKKTHGQATERYLKHVLPKMGCYYPEHFDVDPNDGNRKFGLKMFVINIYNV